MPSPVGHSLIGLAIGLAWLVPRQDPRELGATLWRKRFPLAGAVALANAPDVDYVPGLFTGDWNAYHHFYTHTPGWCVLVAAGIWCAGRAIAGWPLRHLVWIFALTMSHIAADFVTADGRPPIGIMSLWPFEDGFHISPVTLFWRLHKRDLADALQWHNVGAVLVELVWTLPLAALALVSRIRNDRRPA